MSGRKLSKIQKLLQFYCEIFKYLLQLFLAFFRFIFYIFFFKKNFTFVLRKLPKIRKLLQFYCEIRIIFSKFPQLSTSSLAIFILIVMTLAVGQGIKGRSSSSEKSKFEQEEGS